MYSIYSQQDVVQLSYANVLHHTKGHSLQADTLAYNNFHFLFPPSAAVLFPIVVCEPVNKISTHMGLFWEFNIAYLSSFITRLIFFPMLIAFAFIKLLII